MQKDNLFYKMFKDEMSNKSFEYADAYEDAFLSLRKEVKLLFEIGVDRGGSIKGWEKYFPNAQIVGLDARKECYFEDDSDRIEIEIGDATQKEFIDSMILKYGNPDIVIDDGSHYSDAIKNSYTHLFPHTKICYVIEDYGTQYYEHAGGMFINDGIPATNIIHRKIDELIQVRDTCKSIKIYHSSAFIFKNSIDDKL